MDRFKSEELRKYRTEWTGVYTKPHAQESVGFIGFVKGSVKTYGTLEKATRKKLKGIVKGKDNRALSKDPTILLKEILKEEFGYE